MSTIIIFATYPTPSKHGLILIPTILIGKARNLAPNKRQKINLIGTSKNCPHGLIVVASDEPSRPAAVQSSNNAIPPP
jgi:hypothetical protein